MMVDSPEFQDIQDKKHSVSRQQGAIIWLTGLSGSGKSTISQSLNQELSNRGIQSFILDGDVIRTGLCKDLGFTPEDRKENIRRIGEVAAILAQASVVTIVAFISPYRSDRDRARQVVEGKNFVEVFIDCPIEECEKRDPKGLYAKAIKGEIPNFTGISAPYEPPLKPEVHLKTNEMSVMECTNTVCRYLNEQKIINIKLNQEG